MIEKNVLVPVVIVIIAVCIICFCTIGIVGGAVFIGFSSSNFDDLPSFPSTPPMHLDPPSQATPPEQPDDKSPIQPIVPPVITSGEQTVTVAGAEPPTLDPHYSTDSVSAVYVVELFSGLVTYNPALELIPDIAENWHISDDKLVYTFALRENAKFHDGKPITADDFKWSFERACDPKTNSPTADTYLGDIVGCQDKLQGITKNVDGVQVIDDHTLEIVISAPKAYFLSKLSYPTAFVLDKETITNKELNGSGPFKLYAFEPGQFIILTKNEHYYRNPEPTLEQLNFILGAISPMIEYENGNLDITGVGISDIERVTDPNNPLNAQLKIDSQLSIFYIGFNINQPPFNDPLIRQAFSIALDKEKIINLVYKKTVPAAHQIVPPSMPGYHNENLKPLMFDPQLALELIAESPYGDISELPEITLHVSGQGGSMTQITEAIIASYLDILGVEVIVQQTDWQTFLYDVTSGTNPYQMFQLGWIGDYPDPQNFLDVLFHSQSKQNHTGYSNPELDKILVEAGETFDIDKRLALYQQAEQIIVDDAVWIPLYFDTEYWLVKPHIQGFFVSPMIIPKFQHIYVGEKLQSY
ncbi:MAG: hypothetical protein B6242_05090 [Anaerolineaceae bacterium 4572_78]|nr:MAG: hypothetical protein B6242_05090 [Anaerolineaceae bacterium 4572_78]